MDLVLETKAEARLEDNNSLGLALTLSKSTTDPLTVGVPGPSTSDQ